MGMLVAAACTEPEAAPPPVTDRDTATVTVTIDAETRHQTMAGFGASERVFDDPHVTNTFDARTGRSAVVLTAAQQDEILDQLYQELRLTRVRPAAPDIGDQGGIEPVNDNGDPNVLDRSTLSFGWKNLDDHCRYAARAGQRGATTFFLSPLFRERWMGTQSTGDAAEYAEWLLAMIQRCAELGVESPYVAIANEPSFERNHMSGQFIRQVILALGPRLRAAGLETMVVLPDDVRSSSAADVAEVVLADPTARQYVGALATHLYDEPLSSLEAMKTLSERSGLPLWMTEFSLSLGSSTGVGPDAFEWANLIHELLATYNVSAVDYQWGFFGQWAPASQFIVLQHDGSNRYTGALRTKEYFVTGQYSRYVRPGAERVAGTSLDPDIKVSAFRQGADLVMVMLNNSTSSRQVTVGVNGMFALGGVEPFLTTRGPENWAAQPRIVARGGRFSATLPPQSLTTFTTEESGPAPAPAG